MVTVLFWIKVLTVTSAVFFALAIMFTLSRIKSVRRFTRERREAFKNKFRSKLNDPDPDVISPSRRRSSDASVSSRGSVKISFADMLDGLPFEKPSIHKFESREIPGFDVRPSSIRSDKSIPANGVDRPPPQTSKRDDKSSTGTEHSNPSRPISHIRDNDDTNSVVNKGDTSSIKSDNSNPSRPISHSRDNDDTNSVVNKGDTSSIKSDNSNPSRPISHSRDNDDTNSVVNKGDTSSIKSDNSNPSRPISHSRDNDDTHSVVNKGDTSSITSDNSNPSRPISHSRDNDDTHSLVNKGDKSSIKSDNSNPSRPISHSRDNDDTHSVVNKGDTSSIKSDNSNPSRPISHNRDNDDTNSVVNKVSSYSIEKDKSKALPGIPVSQRYNNRYNKIDNIPSIVSNKKKPSAGVGRPKSPISENTDKMSATYLSDAEKIKSLEDLKIKIQEQGDMIYDLNVELLELNEKYNLYKISKIKNKVMNKWKRDVVKEINENNKQTNIIIKRRKHMQKDYDKQQKIMNNNIEKSNKKKQ